MLINRLFLLLVISITLSCTNTPNHSLSTLNNYKSALINKDTSLILTTLSDNFRVRIHQRPIANTMVKNLLLYTQLPDSVSFGEIQNKNGLDKISVSYHFKSDSIITSDITLSSEGKIIFSDYFDHIYSFNRYKKSTKVSTVPFELKHGSILVKARLNNSSEPLNMLFDTGADGMALKSSLTKDIDVKITNERTTNVPGGQVKVKFSKDNSIYFDSLTIANQNMVIFDHIGRESDAILGGANLFRNYITEVNFDKQLISLYTHGQFTAPQDYFAVDLDYSAGIPVIPFSFYSNNNLFKSSFVFDTGAQYDAIMFGPGVKEHNISQHIPALYSSFNHSPGKASHIDIGMVDSLTLAGFTFKNVNLAMERYDANRHAKQKISGSLGIELLRRMNWIVDLTNYKLYLKPNAYSKQPFGFKIKNYMFELNHNNRLFLKHKIKTDLSPDNLQPGDEIIYINNLLPGQLSVEQISKLNHEKLVTLIVLRDSSSFKVEMR